MSESIGPASLNVYGNIYGSYSPSSSDSGLGTSYNPLNTGPPTSGGASSTGLSTGSTVPKPPASVSDPGTGRETPDAPIEFLAWDGYHGATGTAQQILDQLPALFKYNDARAKSASLVSGGTPALRLPGGYVMQFSNGFALTQYLTRSAQPVVPTAAVAATFQSVLGRASSDQDVAQAESTFNAGKSLADYRANLVASPETVNTLEVIRRQVLGRDATPTELAADKAQLGAGKSMDDLRFDLAHGAEAAADVAGLFQSVLGRAASGPDMAGREAQLTTGGSLDAVRQDLASSPEARNEVAAAFKAELGRDAPDPNITGMQQMLAAKGGSIDEVRVLLAGTKETHDKVAAAFKGELGRDAPDPNITGMQQMLAAKGGSIDGVRSFLAGTTEAGTDIIALYQYGLGRAPTAPELTAAQATLAQNGSLRDTYQSLGGIAGAGLVGNADQFSAVLWQADLLGGGAQSAGQRALQGVLSWAARNGPSLTAGGVAGAILLTPLNSQQQATEVGVADHPELGARWQRAPGSISGSVTLYLRGPDGQPGGEGLKLDMDARGQLTGPAGTSIAGLLFGTLPPGATDGGVQLAADLDVTLAGQQAPIGFSFELRTDEESNLVASLRTQGKGVQEIQTALDNLRKVKGDATDPGFPRTVTGQVVPTPKDGVVGGVPTGRSKSETDGDATTQRSHKLENQSAKILAAAGYRVEQTPELRPSDNIEEVKDPDLRISENIFDVYSPKTADLDTIRDTFSGKTKSGQAYRLVVNLTDTPATVDGVRSVLARKPVAKLHEALAIDKTGQIIRIFP